MLCDSRLPARHYSSPPSLRANLALSLSCPEPSHPARHRPQRGQTPFFFTLKQITPAFPITSEKHRGYAPASRIFQAACHKSSCPLFRPALTGQLNLTESQNGTHPSAS